MQNLPVSSEHCCGCTACASVCPKHAITMKEDAQGFSSPVLNESLCVDCGLCQAVCPIVHPNKHKAVSTVQAAWIKNASARANSSSGGLSYALARSVLLQGGIVVGAAMDNFHVHHVIIDQLSELPRISGSKYVQSNMGDIYPQVQKELDAGRYVFFTGTPCQVSGLRNYLRKDYANLLTADLICHGVPSPGVLRKYVDELKENYYTAESCSFRDKVNNWNSPYAFALYDKNGKTVFREKGPFNVYIKGFLGNIFTRASCASCPFTSVERVGDVTLADFWKIGNHDSALTDKKGTSLIFLNSEKGAKAFTAIEEELAINKEVPLAVAVAGQAQLRGPAKKSPLRLEFFEHFAKNGRIEDFLEKKLYKVGILNFHFANNFGAVLVPFALAKAVEKLGHKAEIINYLSATPPHNANFEAFRSKFFARSREITSKADLEKISPWWKRIIVGSDQVWRLFDTGIYMLNWAAGKKSLISYAASFGGEKFTGTTSIPETSMLLSRFDAISVREDSGVNICEQTFGVPAVQVLDPTLLLPASEYIKIIDEEKPAVREEKYVGMAVINSKNKEEIRNNPKVLSDIKKNYSLVNALVDGEIRSVAGWLSTIRNAEYMIADSFHGIVFSIIFKKQFVCVVKTGVNGGDRIPSLLRTLHIDQSRIYSSINDINMSCFDNKIDYDIVDKYIEIEREKSFSFLRCALNRQTSWKGNFYKISNYL